MLDEYINMTDGVKMKQKDVKNMSMIAKRSENLHGCNSERNKQDAYKHWRRLKNIPTQRMLKEVDRLNDICIEHGIAPILVSSNNVVDDRKFLGAKIHRKMQELIDNGISVVKNEEPVRCGDCLYFRRTIGKSGFCRHMHAQAKEFYGCERMVKKA